MAVSRPLDQWPLLICGPMLRRVTPRSVNVFVALREAATVSLLLYNVPNPTTTEVPLATTSPPSETIALGSNLHVLVVACDLSDATPDLEPDKSYFYDLRFTVRRDNSIQTLRSLELLDGLDGLGYHGEWLPSFALPPGLASLKLIHGSCRKAHGLGLDMLAGLDFIIQTTREAPLERPHQLLLTGDQIYADDVSVAFLATIRETADLLLGWTNKEQLPFKDPAASVGPNDEPVLPGPRRGTFINDQTTFTAGIGDRSLVDAHLMFLGEFYAMYLLMWSDSLWPRNSDTSMNPYTLPTADELRPGLGPLEDEDDNDYEKKYLAKIEHHREQALNCALTLHRVRRALANVPTYMIFDDHEVTDDWNLNRKWVERFRANPPARQIVRNALLAYAVFQDWGNQPAAYKVAPGQTLLDAITYDPTNGAPLIQQAPDVCDLLLDIQPLSQSAPRPEQRMRWNYVVPGPEHRILMLDTRTWRAFPVPPNPSQSPAALVQQPELARQLRLLDAPHPTLNIVVSPAPVIGHPLVEEYLQKIGLGMAKRALGAAKYDYEPWAANRAAYEDLLRRLAEFGRVIVLSGDVHYAFSHSLAYFPDGNPAPQSARIVQLCASSIKNQDNKTRLIGGSAGVWRMGWLGFTESFADTMADPLKKAVRAQAERGETFASLHWKLILEDRLRAPAVLPSGPWLFDEAFQIVRALANNVVTGQSLTNWRYTVIAHSDVRTPEQRIGDVPGLRDIIGAELDHDERAFLVDQWRTVVGTNNLGELSFALGAAGTTDVVLHRLYWRPLPGWLYSRLLMFTEHSVSLSMPPVTERPEVIK